MSQGDSFISEVAEEVRRDRMFRLWRRYGAYVIVAIFVVVAAAAVNAWLTRNAEDRARQQMEEVLASIDDDSAEETAKALDEILDDLDGGYQVLAGFRSAAAHLEVGDFERASELYRSIATQDNLKPWFTELAELKAVLAESEDMAPADLVRALRPHVLEGRIYRVVAQEILAGALVAAGDDEEALALIEEALDNPDLGGAAQRRLGELRDVVEARADSAEVAEDVEATMLEEAPDGEAMSDAETTSSDMEQAGEPAMDENPADSEGATAEEMSDSVPDGDGVDAVHESDDVIEQDARETDASAEPSTVDE